MIVKLIKLPLTHGPSYSKMAASSSNSKSSPIPLMTTRLCNRIIHRILQQRHLCGIDDSELDELLQLAKKQLEPEPALLEIKAPVVVFGDTHGQLNDLIKWFQVVGFPPQNTVLFLGDYVDRCKKSLEVITLLLSYKVLYPQQLLLLRGNHECSKMNRIYGFYEEIRRKRSPLLWKKFNAVFNELPLCAAISRRILCMHGGISPAALCWDKLRQLQKPRTPKACDDGIAQDLMWSDPTSDPCTGGFQYNSNRACSVMFDESSVSKLCAALNIDFVCRAHEVVQKGHHWHFDNRLVTLFSAPNYCGAEGNCGSVMHVSLNLDVWFTTLKPMLEKEALTQRQIELLQKQIAIMEAKSPDPNVRRSTSNADQHN